jgi:hypothetical protein
MEAFMGTRAWSISAAALAASIWFGGIGSALAGGYCSDLRLACENGHRYPICPIAVSEAGELVTGYLRLAPNRGIHIRLVPMGVGYRYIGRGVWFDGLRGDAGLFLRKDHAIACTVEAG